MISLDYLIVGTGRSGTVGGAKLLNSLGIPCGHECIFTNKGFDSKNKKNSKAAIWCGEKNEFQDLRAESSYMACPFIKDLNPETQIIHLVRNPFDVVASFVYGLKYFQFNKPSNSYENFIYHHLPVLKENLEPIERAVTYYIQWNEMIEFNSFGKKYIKHQVEDGNKKLLDKIGIYCEQFYDERNCNSVPHRHLSQMDVEKFKNLFIIACDKTGYPFNVRKFL